MPNHVTHQVNVHGSKAAIDAFLVACFTQGEDERLDLDFQKIIPMPEILNGIESSSVTSMAVAMLGEDGILEKENPYAGIFSGGKTGLAGMLTYPWVIAAGVTDVETLREHLLKAHPELPELMEKVKKAIEETGFTNWYPWKIENWGTKWGAYSQDVSRIDDEHLALRFDCAWSVPVPILMKLTELHPGLVFEVIAFDEGWNFGYDNRFADGKAEKADGYTDASDLLYERVYGEKPEREDEDEEEEEAQEQAPLEG